MFAPLLALTDACVLVPAALCDFLLRAAAAGLYQIRWSDEILAEVRRTLVGDLGKSEAQADRRLAAMKRAFPDALVTIPDALLHDTPIMVHPKDRHVVAAAIVSGGAVIVTSNLRDFPAPALAPYAIEALSPDAFLSHLFINDEEAVKAIITKQAAALHSPPMTTPDIIEALRHTAPRFAELLSG